MINDRDLKAIWRQDNIAVIAQRLDTLEVFVKLPNYQDDPLWRVENRIWLRRASPNGRIPRWREKIKGWHVPKSWITPLIRNLLDKYGECFVIQPFRPLKKCANNCMNAHGLDCDCSCMGEFHGTGGPNSHWFEISDTFAVSWGDKELGCRHIKQAD